MNNPALRILFKLFLQLVALCVGVPCTLVLGFSFLLWNSVGYGTIPFVALGIASAYFTVWVFDLIEEGFDE